MASTINALTGSGGVATTADSSGVLDLQSAGTTIATVSSAGIAMASGKTLTGDAISNGKILQVLQSVKTDTFTTTNTAFQIPSGLSVAITPSSTSSKILVMVTTQFAVDADTGHGYAILQRDGTVILQGDAAGSRPRTYVAQNNFGSNAPPNYQLVALDSPSTTSAVTYSLGVRSSNATTVYLNRAVRDNNDTGFDARSASTIIVMEVGG
jgi:hypothetical protein